MTPRELDSEEFVDFLKRTGEEPFIFDLEEDGEATFTVVENGDLVVECAKSGRIRKYPYDLIEEVEG